MNNVSVIIPTKNRLDDVVRCLDSIEIQSHKPCEILIIDQSENSIKDSLKGFNLQIRYFHEPEITGLTQAENFGISKSNGDVITILDDDVILDENYIANILLVFEKYGNEVGGVTGNEIIKENRNKQRLFPSLINILSKIFFLTHYGDGYFLPSGMPKMIESGSVDDVTQCEFLYGFNMSFRKEVISKIKFDENLVGYSWGEDDDIAYRISREYKNYYTPHAQLIHAVSPPLNNDKSTEIEMSINNHYYLFKKNIKQNYRNKLFFWWSIIGMMFTNTIYSILNMNMTYLNGYFKGLKSIFNSKYV